MFDLIGAAIAGLLAQSAYSAVAVAAKPAAVVARRNRRISRSRGILGGPATNWPSNKGPSRRDRHRAQVEFRAAHGRLQGLRKGQW